MWNTKSFTSERLPLTIVAVFVTDFVADGLTNFCLFFLSLKPGSHRKIVKDYRSKTGKDQEILGESG